MFNVHNKQQERKTIRLTNKDDKMITLAVQRRGHRLWVMDTTFWNSENLYIIQLYITIILYVCSEKMTFTLVKHSRDNVLLALNNPAIHSHKYGGVWRIPAIYITVGYFVLDSFIHCFRKQQPFGNHEISLKFSKFTNEYYLCKV